MKKTVLETLGEFESIAKELNLKANDGTVINEYFLRKNSQNENSAKNIIKDAFKEVGFDKFTIKQRVIIFYCAFSFFALLCCNYDASSWYSLPALLTNLAVSLSLVKKFVSKDFNNNKK